MERVISLFKRPFAGRINRLPYLISYMFIFACFYTLSNAIIHVLGIALAIFPAQKSLILSLDLFLLIILYIVYYYAQTVLVIARLHDMGLSGWYVLFSYIPLFGTILALGLFLQKGNPNKNKYGDPPKK
jgi:uncharacterized membrane protein YhaH (DUF805 family)